MINCKFTNAINITWGGTLWTPGEWRETGGSGELCGPGWLHYYEHPLLAELHYPVHGLNGRAERLWEVEIGGEVRRDGQMKAGCTRLRLVREIERPVITTTQRVAYGILAAKAVCADPDWNRWADRWLSGEDRSAAYMAEYAAEAAWRAAVAANAADLDLLAIAKRAMEVTA